MEAGLKSIFPYMVAFFLLGGVGLHQYAVFCQTGKTSDSVLYLSIASAFDQDLKSGFDHPGLTHKPFLYPLLLSVFGENGKNYFNAFFLVLTYMLIYILISELISNQFLQLISMATICWGTPLLLVTGFYWTETLFIFLVVVNLIALIHYFKSYNIGWYLVLILVANLMSLTRHAGIFIMIGTFLSLLLLNCKKQNLKRSIIYLFLGGISFVLWNFIMSTGISDRLTLLGAPVIAVDPSRYWSNLLVFSDALSTWFLPKLIYPWIRVPLVFLCLAFLGFQLFRFNGNDSVKLLAVILVIYFMMIQLAFKVEPWSAERYLSPVFPIMFLIVFGTVQDLELKKIAWLNMTYFKLLATLWWLYPLIRTIKNIAFWHQSNCETLATSAF